MKIKSKQLVTTAFAAMSLFTIGNVMAAPVVVVKKMEICGKSEQGRMVKKDKQTHCDIKDVAIVFDVNKKYANRNLVKSLVNNYAGEAVQRAASRRTAFDKINMIKYNLYHDLSHANSGFEDKEKLFNTNHVQVII